LSRRAVSVTPAEGEALREWVKREGATRTVQIGLGYGVSALYICQGLLANGRNGARHVVIDPHQETRFAGDGLRLLDEAGVGELAELHPDESQIVLPRLLSEGRRFDLAFLGRLVRPEGIVFLDDYQLPAVARAASFCTTNLGWKVEEISAPDDLHRWAVLRTPAAMLERPFDHFVDF